MGFGVCSLGGSGWGGCLAFGGKQSTDTMEDCRGETLCNPVPERPPFRPKLGFGAGEVQGDGPLQNDQAFTLLRALFATMGGTCLAWTGHDGEDKVQSRSPLDGLASSFCLVGDMRRQIDGLQIGIRQRMFATNEQDASILHHAKGIRRCPTASRTSRASPRQLFQLA